MENTTPNASVINHRSEVDRQVSILSDALSQKGFSYLKDISIDSNLLVDDLNEIGKQVVDNEPALTKKELINVLHETLKNSFDRQLEQTFPMAGTDGAKPPASEIFFTRHATSYQAELLKESYQKNPDLGLEYIDPASHPKLFDLDNAMQSQYITSSLQAYSQPMQQAMLKDISEKRQWHSLDFDSIVNTAEDSAADYSEILERVGMPAQHLSTNIFPDAVVMHSPASPFLSTNQGIMHFANNSHELNSTPIHMQHIENELNVVYSEAQSATSGHPYQTRIVTSLLHDSLDGILKRELGKEGSDTDYSLVLPDDIQYGLQQVAFSHMSDLSLRDAHHAIQDPTYQREFGDLSVINPIYNPYDTHPFPKELSKGEYELVAGTLAKYPQGSQQQAAFMLSETSIKPSSNLFNDVVLNIHNSLNEMAVVSLTEDPYETMRMNHPNKALYLAFDFASTDFMNEVKMTGIYRDMADRATKKENPTPLSSSNSPATKEAQQDVTALDSNPHSKNKVFDANTTPADVADVMLAFSKAKDDVNLDGIQLSNAQAQEFLVQFSSEGSTPLPPTDFAWQKVAHDTVLLDQLQKHAESIEPNKNLDKFFQGVVSNHLADDYISLGSLNAADSSVNPAPMSSSLTQKQHLAFVIALSDSFTASNQQYALSSINANKALYEDSLKGNIDNASTSFSRLDSYLKSSSHHDFNYTSAGQPFREQAKANAFIASKDELQERALGITFTSLPLDAPYVLTSDDSSQPPNKKGGLSPLTQDTLYSLSYQHETVGKDIRGLNLYGSKELQFQQAVDSTRQLVKDVGEFSHLLDEGVDSSSTEDTLEAHKDASLKAKDILMDVERMVNHKHLDDTKFGYNVDKSDIRHSASMLDRSVDKIDRASDLLKERQEHAVTRSPSDSITPNNTRKPN